MSGPESGKSESRQFGTFRCGFEPLAHAWLELRTHKVCAIRLETAYGMVSNSAKPKRSDAYGNAEPSFGAKALFEGVETRRHPPKAKAMVKALSREWRKLHKPESVGAELLQPVSQNRYVLDLFANRFPGQIIKRP